MFRTLQYSTLYSGVCVSRCCMKCKLRPTESFTMETVTPVWFLFTRAKSSPTLTGNQTTSCDSTWKSDSYIFFFINTFYRFQCFKKQKSWQMNFTLLDTSRWRCVLQRNFFVKKEKKKKSTAKNAVNCRLLLETPVKMSDFFDDRLFPKLFHF